VRTCRRFRPVVASPFGVISVPARDGCGSADRRAVSADAATTAAFFGPRRTIFRCIPPRGAFSAVVVVDSPRFAFEPLVFPRRPIFLDVVVVVALPVATTADGRLLGGREPGGRDTAGAVFFVVVRGRFRGAAGRRGWSGGGPASSLLPFDTSSGGC
jgi:hypothetical protein